MNRSAASRAPLSVVGAAAESGTSGAPGGISLAGLAANGGALLRCVGMPRPQTDVLSIDIYDPLHPRNFVRGSLLLGVGLDPADPGAMGLLGQAAEHGVAAVALSGEVDAVARMADADLPLAVFAVAPGAAWAHVHTVVRSLIATPTAGRDLMTPYQDLFSVANTVAAQVGGAVTIEDADSQLLAFSTPQEPVDERRLETILGRATPNEYTRGMRQSGIFARLAHTGEPVLLERDDAAGLRARLAIAVKAGEEVLGYVWVVEGQDRLGPADTDALRELAPIVALQLLRVIAAGSADRVRRRDLAAAALDGSWTGSQVAELALRRGESVMVTCLDHDVTDASYDDAQLTERACQLVEVYFATYRVRGMVTRRGGRVYCILAVDESVGLRYAQTTVTALISRLTVTLRVPFTAGLGDIVQPRAITRSRDDAELALRAGRLLNIDSSILLAAELRDRLLLVAIRDAPQLLPFVECGSVVRMREADATDGTQHIASLDAFLNAHGNIPAASRSLHVHPNTLRYRLARITDLFGVDLENPSERLALHLHLWLASHDHTERRASS